MFQSLKRELLAGLTVSVVALPLALAFGIQAVGSSEGAIIGLYGAIITGFFAAVFGGTPKQVTGPTGPITVIFTGIVAQYGLSFAFIAAFLGGMIQIMFGILKLGNYIKFIPLPVISGFMNGIAIIIIIGQLSYVSNSLLIVIVTILLMLAANKWVKGMPSSLLALIFGTLAVVGLEKIVPVLTYHLPLVGDISIFSEVERIGAIPKGLPQFHLPLMEVEMYMKLLPAAFSIAVLGSIDSLLTSVVMDNLTGTKHKSNKELIGQGIGNSIAGLLGGMPGAGATVRSVVNLRAGGKTALSAMTHSVFLLLIMLVLGDFASQIPLAVLAGILIITGITMFDYDSFKLIKTEPRADAFVMLLTMVLTVAVDLMVAVGAGVIFSALVFMKRINDEGVIITTRKVNDLSIYSINGPVYFGFTDRLLSRVTADNGTRIVLDMEKVTYIDASAAIVLLQIQQQLTLNNQSLYLSNMSKDVRECLKRMKVLENIETIEALIDTA
jgi:sulfate permease, SulP family